MDWENLPFLWERLRRETRPIVLYGMGDGADKTLALCARYGVPVAGVFASDGFVREKVYRGFPVRSLAQTEAALGDFVVLLCFATQRPEVLAQIRAVADRHPLFVPDTPLFGDYLLTPETAERDRALLAEAAGLLADEASRQVFRDVLAYKYTGDPAYLWRCESPREAVFADLLPLGGAEVYVDGGAYTGDTVEEFLRHTGGNYNRIAAIEPDLRNFRKLEAHLAGMERVECHNLALWREKTVLAFSGTSGRQAALGRGGKSVPADRLDSLLAGWPVTYLKLDVEGAEEEVLRGSAEILGWHRPKLAVAAYHRGDDLFRLPLLLHRLQPAYRLYLRHHPYLPAWETNVYAICNN